MGLLNREIIKIAEQQLKDAGIENAEGDARELFSWLFGYDKLGLIMHWQDSLQDSQCEAYFGVVAKRASRVPLQYIIGKQEFMGLDFKVTPDVLIPRQETEILVEEALKYASGDVLDLCTGSGAIAVSIAKLSKGAKVTATDISDDALEIARYNAEANGVKVKLLKSDMFEAVKSGFGQKKFSLIVSNPPYIETAVISTLEPEVAEHEPKIALDGGDDGLKYYRIIAEKAPDFMKKKAKLIMEIGYDQKDAVKELLENTLKYENVTCLKDLAGNDRVIIAAVKEK